MLIYEIKSVTNLFSLPRNTISVTYTYTLTNIILQEDR